MWYLIRVLCASESIQEIGEQGRDIHKKHRKPHSEGYDRICEDYSERHAKIKEFNQKSKHKYCARCLTKFLESSSTYFLKMQTCESNWWLREKDGHSSWEIDTANDILTLYQLFSQRQTCHGDNNYNEGLFALTKQYKC